MCLVNDVVSLGGLLGSVTAWAQFTYLASTTPLQMPWIPAKLKTDDF